MANPVERIRTFYEETMQEAKKCTWPPRAELISQTAIVLVTTAAVTLFILGVDGLARTAVQFILTR
jgi:preprotein translocase SecE subunit